MEQQSRGKITEEELNRVSLGRQNNSKQFDVLLLVRHITTRWRKEEMPRMGKEMHHMEENESFCQMLPEQRESKQEHRKDSSSGGALR